jgi:hypothetical protein
MGVYSKEELLTLKFGGRIRISQGERGAGNIQEG